MRLLLDTHVALWAVADDARLAAGARDLIADPSNDVFVSVATVWEIAIKHALYPARPNALAISAAEAVRYFAASGYLLLPVLAAHGIAVERLPPIHGDPFDRMLIAQALTEPLRLVTSDAELARYSDTVIRI
ncbi:MAG: type II toxin-antitoxin system VapC family toxin [Alphaproteobacteria bacterium]|nr:type II toxin-antitoxin system VapC family toxin [Alphaproteobacteria bacterium]